MYTCIYIKAQHLSAVMLYIQYLLMINWLIKLLFFLKKYMYGFFFTLIFIYVDAEHFKSNNYPISKTFTGICIKPLVFVILCMCENNMILDSDLKINAYIKKDKNELFVNNKRSRVQQASIQIFPKEGMGGYFWLSAVG